MDPLAIQLGADACVGCLFVAVVVCRLEDDIVALPLAGFSGRVDIGSAFFVEASAEVVGCGEPEGVADLELVAALEIDATVAACFRAWLGGGDEWGAEFKVNPLRAVVLFRIQAARFWERDGGAGFLIDGPLEIACFVLAHPRNFFGTQLPFAEPFARSEKDMGTARRHLAQGIRFTLEEGAGIIGGKFHDFQVAPFDAHGRFVFTYPVDLQADDALAFAIVDQFRDVYAVEVGLDHWSVADDADGIPDTRLEGSLRFCRFNRGEPTPGTLVKDPGAPLAVGGIDLALVSPHAIALFANLAAKLHATIQGWMRKVIVFEYEVAVFAIRAEESIRSVRRAGAHDDTLLNFVSRGPAVLLPAIERLAIEKRSPGASLRRTKRSGQEECRKENVFHGLSQRTDNPQVKQVIKGGPFAALVWSR